MGLFVPASLPGRLRRATMKHRDLLARVFAMTWIAILLSTVGACSDCNRQQRSRAVPVTVGQTVHGQLAQGDWTDVFADGSFTDLYEVQLAAGQRMTVELRSSDFDSYLSLMRGPGDQLVDNDDINPHNTNSRLTYQSQLPGRYFIAVTTLSAGETGSYTLYVTEGGEEPSHDGGAKAPSPDGGANAPSHDGGAKAPSPDGGATATDR